MTFPALKDAEGRMEAKRQELAAIFSEAGPDMDFGKVKSVRGSTHDVVAHIRALNDELTDLGKEVDKLRAVKQASERARTPGDGAAESGDGAERQSGYSSRQKSAGELFVESRAYKAREGSVGPV